MLTKDYIRIYISNTDFLDDASHYARVYDSLPAFRKEKVDSLNNDKVKKQSMSVFALLIKGLEELGLDMSDTSVWDELKYTTGEYGKPYFAGREDIHFSLSHTNGAALCAISGSPVGCDIEHIRKRSSLYTAAKRVLTPAEMAYCMRVGQSENTDEDYSDFSGICIDPVAFYHLWTRKEAYSKYTGTGLKEILTVFDTNDIEAYLYSAAFGKHIWAVCADAAPDPRNISII